MSSVTFKRKPVNLAGSRVEVGDSAPPFKAISNDLKLFKLTDLTSDYKIITSFPSLDTPVCDLQVKQFNQQAAELSDEVIVVGISKDLPFAQQRFCSMNEINNVQVVSDYRFTSFGYHYGVLIEELNLLARTVFILDSENIIRYIQIVDEITSQPDYQEVLDNLTEIVSQKKNSPAPSTAPTLPKNIQDIPRGYERWELNDNYHLKATFNLPPSKSPRFTVKAVLVISEQYEIQPFMTYRENKLILELSDINSAELTPKLMNFVKAIDRLKI